MTTQEPVDMTEDETLDEGKTQILKKRRRKFKQLASTMRQIGTNAKYCIFTENDDVWKTFSEFSGKQGAKEALDESRLPPGSAIVRISDGVELAYRSAVR